MRKKIIAFLVVFTMIATLGTSPIKALAEEEGTPTPTPGVSAQEATVTGSAATGTETTPSNGMVVTGDDDVIEPTEDNSGATDINVWAKITGANGDDVIYSIKVTWGNMQFIYDWGGSWDPVSHTYSTGEDSNSASAGWVLGQLDSTNNKIEVTNDSNYPITSSFAYANALTDSKSLFNDTPTATNSVMGVFASDNDTLTTGINTDAYNGVGATSADAASIASFNLDTLDTTCTVLSTDEAREGTNIDSIYFSLCGTPDTDKVLSDYSNVGVITVTITPYSTSIE